MRTRFRFILPAFVTLLVIVFGAVVVVMSIIIFTKPERFEGIMILVLAFFLVSCLLLFREMRFKFNVVEIGEKGLLARSFFGLGPDNYVPYEEISAINATFEPTRYSAKEALYIYIDNRRALEISESYCRNFSEFRDTLFRKKKDLFGPEDFSFLKIFGSAFGWKIMHEEE